VRLQGLAHTGNRTEGGEKTHPSVGLVHTRHVCIQQLGKLIDLAVRGGLKCAAGVRKGARRHQPSCAPAVHRHPPPCIWKAWRRRGHAPSTRRLWPPPPWAARPPCRTHGPSPSLTPGSTAAGRGGTGQEGGRVTFCVCNQATPRRGGHCSAKGHVISQFEFVDRGIQLHLVARVRR
jgi:hypothetical protein